MTLRERIARTLARSYNTGCGDDPAKPPCASDSGAADAVIEELGLTEEWVNIAPAGGHNAGLSYPTTADAPVSKGYTRRVRPVGRWREA
jgi:hypothetical protein